jgi:hypothetical protein
VHSGHNEKRATFASCTNDQDVGNLKLSVSTNLPQWSQLNRTTCFASVGPCSALQRLQMMRSWFMSEKYTIETVGIYLFRSAFLSGGFGFPYTPFLARQCPTVERGTFTAMAIWRNERPSAAS